ncbi:MAG: hypothetical protein Q8Q89_04180 [bacterium]|nr:hypothetical protein [bacterium]
MQSTKFLVFLIASLALTAFLAGYVLVGQEVKDDGHHSKLAMVPIVKTGTLLDRFERINSYPEENIAHQELFLPEIKTKKFLNLNHSISAYAISPDSQKIAYFIPPKDKNKEGSVSVSDLDGSNSKTIFKTRVANLGISWINEIQLSIEIDPLKEPIILLSSE